MSEYGKLPTAINHDLLFGDFAGSISYAPLNNFICLY